MTLTDLAREVLHLLRLQEEHERTKNRTRLAEVRDAERRLRKKVEEIVNPPQPSMFEGQ